MKFVRVGTRYFNLSQITHVVIESAPAPNEPAAFLFMAGAYGRPEPISKDEWPLLEAALAE